MRGPRGLLTGVGALVAGLISGAAGTVLHDYWWGLLLGLATALTVLAWLPPGGVRLVFALGWCVPVLRGALPGSGGGYLVGSDAAGWSFLAGTGVLVVAALATVGARRGSVSSGSALLHSPRADEAEP